VQARGRALQTAMLNHLDPETEQSAIERATDGSAQVSNPSANPS